jgi:hypothetical protein
MYNFTASEKELEPQSSGRGFGPPCKYTAAGLLDPPHLPPIRPRCFGCSEPLLINEIRLHILNCANVLPEDLARFETALTEFEVNPGRAFEIAEALAKRVRSASRY